MENINIVFIVFIVIFSITAIITLLGITNIIKTIKERYLNVLFTALIIEVVASVIISYKQIDLNCQTDTIIERLTENLNEIDPNLSNDKKVAKLVSILNNSQDSKSKIEVLQNKLTACEDSKEKYGNELDKLDKVFYSNVIKLRLYAEKLRGRTINLVWNKEEKKEVYQLLSEIFIELGYVNPNKELTNDFIIQKYIRFIKENALTYLLKENDSGTFNQILIDEYVTTIFLRKYLNQKYPLNKN